MLILDPRRKSLSGKAYTERLADAGIITNFNMVPGDPRQPAVTSGIRLGTPAVTSMGMREGEMEQIAGFIDLVCRHPNDPDVHASVRRDVAGFCAPFCARHHRPARPPNSDTYTLIRHLHLKEMK